MLINLFFPYWLMIGVAYLALITIYLVIGASIILMLYWSLQRWLLARALWMAFRLYITCKKNKSDLEEILNNYLIKTIEDWARNEPDRIVLLENKVNNLKY